MTRAFVDSSVLLAVAFKERGSDAVIERLHAFEVIFASPLADAEVRSAARREAVPLDDAAFDSLFNALIWVHTDRALTPEIQRVLDAGYVRGADCWHLATALYFVSSPADVVFLTLDKRQQDVAAVLGFAI